MKEKLITLKENLEKELKSATKEADILNIKSAYVGKKSEIQELLTNLKIMTLEEKREFGKLINETKNEMEQMINKFLDTINSKSNIDFDDTIDYQVEIGSLHPVTIVAKEVTDILKRPSPSSRASRPSRPLLRS